MDFLQKKERENVYENHARSVTRRQRRAKLQITVSEKKNCASSQTVISHGPDPCLPCRKARGKAKADEGKLTGRQNREVSKRS